MWCATRCCSGWYWKLVLILRGVGVIPCMARRVRLSGGCMIVLIGILVGNMVGPLVLWMVDGSIGVLVVDLFVAFVGCVVAVSLGWGDCSDTPGDGAGKNGALVTGSVVVSIGYVTDGITL